MSQLIALTFANQEDATRARDALHQLERDGRLSLYDAAVISKNDAGELSIRDEIDRDVKIGAGLGGALGLLFSWAFPLVGLVVGGAGGAMVGKLLDRDIDRQFIQELGGAVQPGGSALAVLVREAEADALRAALTPFTGTVYQTTLDTDLEDQLRRALRG
jgi:uncharacterized membrane protein